MAVGKTNPQVDLYVRKATKWRKEMAKLREILLGCQLTEELKWGKPCYMFGQSNVVVILALQKYCSLLLCKGVLLKDPQGILIKAGENTQAARQIRFTSVLEIEERRTVLEAYMREAIAAEKAGLEVTYKKTADFVSPQELKDRLGESVALKTAFERLTPGRQRGYLIHFSAPKQSKTRESRIEKCRQRILNGKGLNDP